MSTPRIVFVGGGNMARSIIGGLVASGHPADRIAVCDPSADKLAALAGEFGIETGDDNDALVRTAEVAVVAVKPQAMNAVCSGLAAAVEAARPLVVSVAAGIRQEALGRWLAYAGPIIRCMPNTPALIGCGVAALHANAAVTGTQRETAAAILGATGRVVWVEDESLLDTVTAISGSGPAYFFAFMEALEQAGREHGLPAETARELVLGTALGAARMTNEAGTDPATLRANVTSKGGTTAAALAAFDSGGLSDLVADAVAAARARSIELGDELGRAGEDS